MTSLDCFLPSGQDQPVDAIAEEKIDESHKDTIRIEQFTSLVLGAGEKGAPKEIHGQGNANCHAEDQKEHNEVDPIVWTRVDGVC
jgi:hypothetical protein